MEVVGDTIVLEIEYDSDELIRPILFYINREPWHRRILNEPQKPILNFLGALTVLYFLDLISVSSVILAAAISVMVSGFASVAFFEWAGSFVGYLQAQYRTQFEKAPKLTYKFEFDDQGIRTESQGDVEIVTWTDIREADEKPLDILLWLRESDVYIFPKRIFQDFDELTYFKNFVRDRIGERATF